MHVRALGLAACAAAFLVLAGCGGGESDEAAAPPAAAPATPADEGAAPPAAPPATPPAATDVADEGGERLTREEFVSAANEICADAAARLNELDQPTSPEEAADVIREGKEISQDQLDALRELEPPAELEASVDEAYGQLEELIGLFDDLAEAVESNDEDAGLEIQGRAAELTASSDAIAAEIGLTECGSG